MKKLFILLITFLIGLSTYAQTPESFKYQAVVRDASGAVISDQTVGIQIQILEDSEFGAAVYVETHSPTTNSFGIINFNIGEGSVQNGTFEAIDWGDYIYFVKVSIDISGGSSYTDMGTSQLLSVPYALQSKTTENFDEIDPVFLAHDAYEITGTDITNWNTTFGWGDHSTIGYLTSFTETDPIFNTSVASGILATDTTNWNTAYNWGNHASAGYLSSFSETDPQVGINTYGYVPRWDGASLSTGKIYDSGSNIGIGCVPSGMMLRVETSSYPYGIYSYTHNSAYAYGMYGDASGTSDSYGLYGNANGSSDNYGVFGEAYNSSSISYGVRGYAHGTGTNYAISGTSSGGTSNWAGYFQGNTQISHGNLYMTEGHWIGIGPSDEYIAFGGSDNNIIMIGANIGIGITDPGSKLHVVNTTSPYGIYSSSHPATGDSYGLRTSVSGSSTCYGLYSYAYGSSDNYGVYGYAHYSTTGASYGVYGNASGAVSNFAIYGQAASSSDNYAGYFYGNLHSTGLNTKAADAIKIDHPLDPENKYLYLSSVESPDMMNLFNGNVIIDSNGEAIVTMPDWFEAVNMEFRYQLTAIGAPGPNLYIKEKIANNKFVIAGGSSGMEVSWMVTGIRNDPFAKEHRIVVEEDKSATEKGKYIHPELYNQSLERGVDYENNKHADEKMNRPDAGINK